MIILGYFNYNVWILVRADHSVEGVGLLQRGLAHPTTGRQVEMVSGTGQVCREAYLWAPWVWRPDRKR